MENTQVGQTPSRGTVQYSTETVQKEKIATAVAKSKAESEAGIDQLFGTALSGIKVIIIIVVALMAIRLLLDYLTRKKKKD